MAGSNIGNFNFLLCAFLKMLFSTFVIEETCHYQKKKKKADIL